MTEIDNFSAVPTMALLRDFQRRTVDHVFSRLYNTKDPAMRFLVADEVGLGKTMVARGLIARSIEHLRDKAKRIDVIYICSNAAIARQNVSRLNPVKTTEVTMATRLTLLPLELAAHGLRDSRLNIISFTPDTSLNLSSRSGRAEERALIYWILEDGDFGRAGLRNLLQCSSGKEGWENRLQWRREYDTTLAADFSRRVNENNALAEELILLP